MINLLCANEADTF